MATIMVPTDQPNLVAAVGVAMVNDEIVVEDGTLTGANNRNVDPGGIDPLTIRSENGKSVCTIDCESAGRAFYIHSGETATCIIDGFYITKGSIAAHGGALYIYDHTHPIIQNCTFHSNTNTSNIHSGGAIAINTYCNPQILNCLFTNNTTYSGGVGGAIYCNHYSYATIKYCVFVGNYALGSGGAISFVDHANSLVHTCLFISNTAVARGGGAIQAHYYSNPTIRTSTFVGNSAGSAYGAAINSRFHSNPLVYDSIMWGNSVFDVRAESFSSLRLNYCDCQIALNCTIANCISTDPLFVTAGWDLYPDYFLNSDADAGADSPCIDAGSQTAVAAGVDDRTTRTDKVIDQGQVDMGYHYEIPLPPAPAPTGKLMMMQQIP